MHQTTCLALQLDFCDDLFVEPLSGQWFRLGAWTITHLREGRGVEDRVFRQTLLLGPGDFAEIFDSLESVGNVIGAGKLGKPHVYITQEGERKHYSYAPFHRFEFDFSSAVAEPLVFVRSTTSGTRLFINPDLWFFSELEEKSPNCGIWWDPRRGVEALRRRLIGQENVEIIEIRTDYLLKYLQARQLSLVVGHYRHLRLFNPSPGTVDMFVEGKLTLGSLEQAAKAVLQNGWHAKDILGGAPFLERRLHLWFQIMPPAIDIEDPWSDQPSFDPYIFTLPTSVGPVAPARWKHFHPSDGRSFEGGVSIS